MALLVEAADHVLVVWFVITASYVTCFAASGEFSSAGG